MQVGILGAGNMATGLGRYFLKAGHKLLISHSRDRGKLEKVVKDLGGGTQAGSAKDAACFGEIVILATTWDGAAGALEAAGSLDGKVLWSIVNPLKADLSGLMVGTTTSGSEELAKLAPHARFVAAWPPFAEVLASGSTRFGSERQTNFYCGDETNAKRAVASLLESLDVDPVDAGPLYAARYLEPSMMLHVHFAYALNMGATAIRLLRR
jgi:predicted dinucleotide-binding enzyme